MGKEVEAGCDGAIEAGRDGAIGCHIPSAACGEPGSSYPSPGGGIARSGTSVACELHMT
jgi:hypothetical protein